jgi:hypothetical protein
MAFWAGDSQHEHWDARLLISGGAFSLSLAGPHRISTLALLHAAARWSAGTEEKGRISPA